MLRRSGSIVRQTVCLFVYVHVGSVVRKFLYRGLPPAVARAVTCLRYFPFHSTPVTKPPTLVVPAKKKRLKVQPTLVTSETSLDRFHLVTIISFPHSFSVFSSSSSSSKLSLYFRLLTQSSL